MAMSLRVPAVGDIINPVAVKVRQTASTVHDRRARPPQRRSPWDRRANRVTSGGADFSNALRAHRVPGRQPQGDAARSLPLPQARRTRVHRQKVTRALQRSPRQPRQILARPIQYKPCRHLGGVVFRERGPRGKERGAALRPTASGHYDSCLPLLRVAGPDRRPAAAFHLSRNGTTLKPRNRMTPKPRNRRRPSPRSATVVAIGLATGRWPPLKGRSPTTWLNDQVVMGEK